MNNHVSMNIFKANDIILSKGMERNEQLQNPVASLDEEDSDSDTNDGWRMQYGNASQLPPHPFGTSFQSQYTMSSFSPFLNSGTNIPQFPLPSHLNRRTHPNNEVWCVVCGRFFQTTDIQEHMMSHVADMSDVSTLFDNTRPSYNPYFPTSMQNQLLQPLTIESINSFMQLTRSNAFRHIPLPLYMFTEDMMDDFDEYEANIQLADMIGNVEVGVPDFSQVSVTVDKDNVDESDACPICIENMKESLAPTSKLICMHQFCQPCISKWLSKSKKCPVCNIDLCDKLEELKGS